MFIPDYESNNHLDAYHNLAVANEFSFENSRHPLDFNLKLQEMEKELRSFSTSFLTETRGLICLHLGMASFRIPCFRACSLGEPLEMLHHL